MGCGKGYSTRDVKCTLNNKPISDIICRIQPKPLGTRHCETTTECKWKTGPWKPVIIFHLKENKINKNVEKL